MVAGRSSLAVRDLQKLTYAGLPTTNN